MTTTKTRKRAHPIREAASRSRSKVPTSEVGWCLREVRECLLVGERAPDAISAWHAAEHRHAVSPGTAGAYDRIPPGVPIFWSGGKHGHVAIMAVKRGYCWSTDIRRPGYFDRVPISEIRAKWGYAFLGWTEDLNGVKVYPNLVNPAEGKGGPEVATALTLLPARVRLAIYVAIALAGVALGGIQTGYTIAETPTPTWVKVAMGVLAYVASLGGATLAAAHTPRPIDQGN